MVPVGEIFIVPFFGLGHLIPAMELCKNMSYHNYNVTLIIPSHLSSSIPSTFTDQSSFIHVTEISISANSSPPGEPRSGMKLPSTVDPLLVDQFMQMGEGIKSFLSMKSGIGATTCVVIDVMMSWSKEIFNDHQIPVVSFATSGATSLAMGFGRWTSKAGELKPGEIKELPGLPVEMAVTFTDLSRRRLATPLRQPDEKPLWTDAVAGSVALLINTCDNLEHLFMDYLSRHNKFPIWGVGPLLPVQFWKSAGSVLHDHEMRSNHKSNYTEDEVIHWLNSRTIGSVIYISFGSEFTPTIEEYKELAKALEESDESFIWVIQPGSGTTKIPRSYLGYTQTDAEDDEQKKGYYPEGLDLKVGDRGLIITGWSPQLLILSHPSTGGFLSHCGWNSTVEAIGLGVPILGWPLRSDQFDNANLVANHLKIGFNMSEFANEDEPVELFRKEHMLAGIQRLMSDEKVHKQAKVLSKEFESRIPVSSKNALGAFIEFVSLKQGQ